MSFDEEYIFIVKVDDGIFSISLAGSRQSPVDILTSQVETSAELSQLEYTYIPANCQSAENTGSSWKVNVLPEGSSLKGGPLLSDIYHLAQFHAHWGGENSRGSEHTVDGKMFSAELHLVHYNSKYGSFGEAADKPDGLAVLGVFIKVGDEHPEFGKLCEVLQDIPRKGDTLDLPEPINPADLLPKNQSYWTYEGSLTTPPLYESVTWIVLKQPIEVSSVQIRIMREMKFGDEASECMKDNYRIHSIHSHYTKNISENFFP
ncbi:carbonic anhydrase [Eurytemora carolleeae]|uniref:carbonic anhydrase n=1 Tax=Eurytemora carolleeae TaxID=1294199 RepID=UPI000C7845B4|nr:carbonic anhydrase [Eurytemora carolleeae]|eukprot:XP_023342769.1 carbonic anhydrase-like [Eurytemora affinis]